MKKQFKACGIGLNNFVQVPEFHVLYETPALNVKKLTIREIRDK